MIRIDQIQGTEHSADLRKIVIKLGSVVVVGPGDQPDMAALGSVADSIAALRAGGVQVILVSSGAIGMGRRRLPEFKARTIPDRQALAAIGQVGLMHTYKDLFEARGFIAAQVLLTRGDMEDRRRYLNARAALDRLLELGAVPVINENDTVTIDELKFGDNDELSALVASKMGADMLVILSSVSGLFDCDPTQAGRGRKAAMVRVVEAPDAATLGLAEATRSGLGTGGMITKLSAMQIAHQAGVHGVIAHGKTPGMIEQILSGNFTGTYFAPRGGRKLSGRHRWLAFGRKAAGKRLIIDDGARRALVEGKKSLLPAGVRAIDGDFARGDIVEVAGLDGELIGRGLVNYDADVMRRILGLKTGQIRELLGAVDYEEAIHRDNLIVN